MHLSTALPISVRLLTLVAAMLCGSATAAETLYNRWYSVLINDDRAGHGVTTVTQDDETVTSNESLKLSISRGGLDMDITFEQTWIETTDGKPISLGIVQGAGGQTVEMLFEFEGETLKTTVTLPGNIVRQTQGPRPAGDWLTPQQAQRKTQAAIEAGDDSVSFQTLEPDPLSGTLKVSEVKRSGMRRTTLDLLGRAAPAIACETSTTATGDRANLEHFDLMGRPLRLEADFGGLKLTMIATDKSLALAELDPPELVASTLVTPNRSIERPRLLERGVYRLATPGEAIRLPTTGRQTVKMDGNIAEVTVDLSLPAERVTDEAASRAMTPTAVIASDDPEIMAFATERLKGVGDDVGERAEALRRAVHDLIDRKSLAVGYATASETIRTKQGDCTEHAVLLAAALRAAGIPARTVSGMTYADQFVGAEQIFAYHMWTQAAIEVDGVVRWVDLDATLPGSVAFDATHIALAVGSGDDGANPMVELAGVLGRLSIDVVEADGQ